MQALRTAWFALLFLLTYSSVGTAQNPEDLCQTVLVPLMEQARLDPNQYARVVGCESNGSSWRMRTVSEIATTSSDAELDQRSLTLQTSVDAMSMSDVFTYSVRFDRTGSELLTIGAQNSEVATDIADQPIGSAPNWLNNYADDYARDIETYLLNAGESQRDLVAYFEWFMARRDATLQSMSSVQNPMASSAFLANWGYMQFPWQWQLVDPLAIRDFVAEQDSSANPSSQGEAILELQFLQRDGAPALGGCVVVYEMVPGSEILFVCDGDQTDLTPSDGSIQIVVSPGSYNVLVSTAPSLYTPGPDANGWVVEVSEGGGKYVFYSA